MESPHLLRFDEMSKKELKDFFAWFLGIVPARIKMLARAVKTTPGFEDWWPDFSPESLSRLGDWFATQCETRERTEWEILKLQEGGPFPIKVSANELTSRTFSVATDIGIYLAKVFIYNYTGVKWIQEFGSKRNVDYGRPLLAGFGPDPLNPIRVAVVLARKLADKRETGKALRELYDKRVEMLC